MVFGMALSIISQLILELNEYRGVLGSNKGVTVDKLCKRFFSVFFYSDLHAVRFILGLAELLWAITLWWPGDTFIRPTYIGMHNVFSEEWWGLVFFITSMCQFHILIQGQYHTIYPRIFAAWNSALWLFVCMSMYLSVFPPPAAISGESALAAGACWVFLRTGYYVTGRRYDDRGLH